MDKKIDYLISKEKNMFVSEVLCRWYDINKRELPWRETQDPYVIWISEIILQQTRVAQGMSYFCRFMDRFPNVSSLAAASEEDVLKSWEGLGYYSRARNLHAAAKTIMDRFGGKFPIGYKDVLSLKGVGGYTAAAIVSFAWNMPYPVVDGNVFRLLSRLFAVSEPIDSVKGKKLFLELAGEIMNPDCAGLHNQAVMEFGALQCTPSSPDCLICPLNHLCMAYASGSVLAYPVKQQKVKTRNRYFYYFHVVYNKESTYLHKRQANDIWKGLYEFPLIETEEPMDFAKLKDTDEFKSLTNGLSDIQISVELSKKKHVLSHQVLYATFYKLEIKEESFGLSSFLKIPLGDMDNYAIPRLVQIYLEKIAGNFVK